MSVRGPSGQQFGGFGTAYLVTQGLGQSQRGRRQGAEEEESGLHVDGSESLSRTNWAGHLASVRRSWTEQGKQGDDHRPPVYTYIARPGRRRSLLLLPLRTSRRHIPPWPAWGGRRWRPGAADAGGFFTLPSPTLTFSRMLFGAGGAIAHGAPRSKRQSRKLGQASKGGRGQGGRDQGKGRHRGHRV